MRREALSLAAVWLGLSGTVRWGRVHPLLIAGAGGLDEALLRGVNLAGTNGFLDILMVFFSIASASYVVVWLMVPLWWRGLREAAFDFLILLAITMLVTEAIKFATGRPRPCEPGVLSNVRTIAGFGCEAQFDPAFPSGHASRAAALAVFLGIRFRWRAGVPASLFVAVAGLSRIYLGVHWPSDVFGGVALGIGLALVLEWTSRRSPGYARIRRQIVEAIPHLPRRTA